MKQMNEFIEKNKDKIIAILALAISFLTALLSMGGKVAIFCTVMIALIELLVFYLKNGLSDHFGELCVSTVKLIVDVLNGEYTETKMIETGEVKMLADGSSKKTRKRKSVCTLTEDMIRDIILNKKEESQDESDAS